MELFEYKSPDEIAEAVETLAAEINSDYAGLEPVVVGVLKGSYMFMADLTRALEISVELDFISASSYGESTVSCREVTITTDIQGDIAGKDVIVVEDIVDTGLTLGCILEHIRRKGPASVRVCALLDKPSRRVGDYHPDYVGMVVEDIFLVGYGLDFAGRYRNLAGLYGLLEDKGPAT